MPNKKSAWKRLRQSIKRRERNRFWKRRIKNTRKKIYKALAEKDYDTAKNLVNTFKSLVDKALAKGVIKKHTASRLKSRVELKVSETVKQ